MSRPSAWFVHGSLALAGATGLVYGWMRYVAEPRDEFAIVNHPWQPELEALHVLTVPLLLFACGLVWRTHVWERLRSGFEARRKSGLLLAVGLLPMAASGYLLQVSAEERWRAIWMWTHGLTSCAWIAVYLLHQLSRRDD